MLGIGVDLSLSLVYRPIVHSRRLSRLSAERARPGYCKPIFEPEAASGDQVKVGIEDVLLKMYLRVRIYLMLRTQHLFNLPGWSDDGIRLGEEEEEQNDSVT
jgi:hypothetical protein